MKKFLRIIGIMILIAEIAGMAYLGGYIRPQLVFQQNREIAEAKRIEEEKRLAEERAEAERLAAIEAARDHRTYHIYNTSTGNTRVDNGIQSVIDEAAEEFLNATENSEEEVFFGATRTFDVGNYFSLLFIYSYNDVSETETRFVSTSTGRVLSKEETLGDNWRTYLSDYFVYNVKKLEQVRDDLAEGYEEVIADAEGNFTTFVVLEDGTANVYFQPNTLTSTGKLEIINVPANVLTGEYYGRRRVDPNKPMVALTFDDGPSEDYSPRILDCLEANNAVATFFEVGRNVDAYPEITKRAADLGCEIGSHTYNHINLPSAYNSTLNDDRAKCEAAFTNAIGYIPYLLRPPEGAIGGSAKYMYDNAFIGWSVDTQDWLNRNVGVTTSVVKNFGNLDGQVILMHSIYETSAASAEIIIPWLIENGYQLVTISELLEYHYGIIEPEAHVYYAVDFFLYGREAY